METKRCYRCGEIKSKNDFYRRGKTEPNSRYLHSVCKECSREVYRNWVAAHPHVHAEYRHRKGLSKPMETFKECALWLGVVIAEKVLSKIFDNITRMPYGNPGYDFICKNGFKIDAKSSCLRVSKIRTSCWNFNISQNKLADYFLCLGFDNRKDLNPIHIWLIPGNIINNRMKLSITNTEFALNKWSKYERPLDKVIDCCNTMRCTTCV